MDQCDNSVREEASSPVSALVRVRHLTESLLFLALAVIFIRAWQLEGYLVSTGSMANSLLGYHKRVTCPNCGRMFAVGTSFDESRPVAGRDVGKAPEKVTCPNCGLPGINLKEVPTTQGDQILIHKEAYLFRDPRRFETAVFRNPSQASQVYVKRVVGLPGETVQIQEGDLFINHERVQKNWKEQRAVRELVHDAAFQQQTSSLVPRWKPEQPQTGWSWSEEEQCWGYTNQKSNAPEGDDWLTYQHWWKQGGRHRTAVLIEQPELTDAEFATQLQQELDQPTSSEETTTQQKENRPPPIELPRRGSPVNYDPATSELYLHGVLTDEWYQKIARLNPEPDKLQAIQKLKLLSHIGPISDFNSYNPPELSMQAHSVRDLAVSCTLKSTSESKFVIGIQEGEREYQLELDLPSNGIQLRLNSNSSPIFSSELPIPDEKGKYEIEFSIFDRQLLVLINDEAVFEPWQMPYLKPEQPYARQPVRLGGFGPGLKVSNLRIYRDLYYRSDIPEPTRHATSEPFELGENNYFVLGDNSMVSWDSRCWENPVVERKYLMGRPLIVHLPSRPGVFEVNRTELPLRIPDLGRIRWIH